MAETLIIPFVSKYWPYLISAVGILLFILWLGNQIRKSVLAKISAEDKKGKKQYENYYTSASNMSGTELDERMRNLPHK